MRATLFFTVALLITIASAKLFKSHHEEKLLNLQEASEEPDWLWYTQKVDHFDPRSTETFQ
jgi:hypothetical protein